MSTGGSHPSFEALADLVEGRIDPEVAGELQAHIAGCARCADDVSALTRLLGTMRADRGEDAPPGVVARAVRLFPAPSRAGEVTLRERIVAALRFDSGVRPLALGLRSPSPAPRQVLYGGGEYDLDMQITLGTDHWFLSGQLLGPGKGLLVVAEGPDGEVTAPIDEQGEFTLPPLRPGRYAFRIVLDAVEMVLPPLDLGA